MTKYPVIKQGGFQRKYGEIGEKQTGKTPKEET